MNYLVAVLPDRIQAEAAYLALEEGIPTNKVTILGVQERRRVWFDPQRASQKNHDYCLSGLCRSALFVVTHPGVQHGAGEVGNRNCWTAAGAGAMGAFHRWWSRLSLGQW